MAIWVAGTGSFSPLDTAALLPLPSTIVSTVLSDHWLCLFWDLCWLLCMAIILFLPLPYIQKASRLPHLSANPLPSGLPQTKGVP